MKNKKFLLLVMALLFVSSVMTSVEAAKPKHDSSRQVNTAGVQGNEGETLKRVKEDKDIEAYCLSDKADECKIKFKEIVDIYQEISKEKKNYCRSLKKGSFKGTSYNDAANKLVAQRNKRADLLEKKEIKDKDAVLVKAYPGVCSSFVDSLKQQSIIDKQEKMKEMADALTNEAKAYKNGNCDQVDVKPLESSSLEHGTLVAWGIPSVRIPTPKPKTNTSSSSSQKAEPKPVTDEGYKALRSVEIESGKVTDTEKDQFIGELNSRVGSN